MIQRFTLILFLTFFCATIAHSKPLERRQVKNANFRHAVCNDSSPAVYYFRSGSGSGSNNWVIFLAGGGFCFSADSCKQRQISTPELMTSTDKPETFEVDGLLSDNPAVNPDFYNANVVAIPYCSSDLWSGNRAKSQSSGGFEYRGTKIFRSVVRDMERKAGNNLTSASRILLSGTSAGGIGTMVHLDWLAARFPNATVKGINDAGWTPDEELLDVLPFSDEFLKRAINFWNGYPDASCALENPGDGLFNCYSAEVYPFLQTPLMVQMSQYDSVYLGAIGVTYPFNTTEKIFAGLFGYAIRESLDPVQAAFSPRTYTHGTLPYDRFYTLNVNGFTVKDILGNWFFNRGNPIRVIR